MTCIIGIAEKGKVYIGGDSMSSNGPNREATALRKVFRTGQFLIGYTTSFRMGQILQYHLIVPPQPEDMSDERYMVVEFIEAVRTCLKVKGYAAVNNNQESGGTFLVGYKSGLYGVYSDFQVNHCLSNVAACGAGEEYALGALTALDRLTPKKRIRRALQIVSQLSNYVCEPFYVETL
jgi:ATP-dependent protease HslVU (ClpYQ) peptidase subunit